MSAYRIELARTKCQSFGRCAKIAPATFALDGAGKVEMAPQPELSGEDVLKAARACPYRAIILYDAQTNDQVFPPARKG